MASDSSIMDRLRQRVAVFALSAGLLASFIFFGLNLSHGAWRPAAIDLALGIFWLGLLWTVLRYRNHRAAAVGIAIGVALFLIAFASSGMVHAYVWAYGVPAVIFFLAGLRWGLCLNGTLFMLFSTFAIGSPPTRFPSTIEVSLVLSFALVVALSYLYERARRIYVKELRRISDTDPLTGVSNRRRFDRVLANEVARATRYEGRLELVLIDVDLFKEINDRFGHPEGDRVLKTFSRAVEEQLRETDMIARLGGDEFAIVMPMGQSKALDEDAPLGSEEACTRITEAAAKVRLPDNKPLSISLGATTLRPGDDEGQLLQRADRALYTSKSEGRGRFTVLT